MYLKYKIHFETESNTKYKLRDTYFKLIRISNTYISITSQLCP